jgi:hypothetical protein
MTKPAVNTTDGPQGVEELETIFTRAIEISTGLKWKSSQAEYLASDIECFATDALDALGRACEEERAYFNNRGEEWE